MKGDFERAPDVINLMKEELIRVLADSRTDFPNGMAIDDLTRVLYEVTPEELEIGTRTILGRALAALLTDKIIEQTAERFKLVVH